MPPNRWGIVVRGFAIAKEDEKSELIYTVNHSIENQILICLPIILDKDHSTLVQKVEIVFDT